MDAIFGWLSFFALICLSAFVLIAGILIPLMQYVHVALQAAI